MPEDTASGFEVPHRLDLNKGWKPDQPGDGWEIVQHDNTVASILANLSVGSVVRAYKVASETGDDFPGHEFIVTRQDASGTWYAVDNTHPGDHEIWEHPLNTDWAAWAYISTLPDHVYISRLAPNFPLPDDYDGNPQTTGTVSVDGGQVLGNIDRQGDADWFKIQLVQGHAYTFHLESGTPPQVTPFLADPYLSLYNSNGEFLSYDDDGGPGLNSELTYTADYTGIYFLSARSAVVGGTGTYRIWDPPAIGTGSLSIDNLSISEGNSGTKVATFTVTRTGGTAAFDVNFFTSDGGATLADGDYVGNSGTLHFGTNVNSQPISITINGDTKVEFRRRFLRQLIWSDQRCEHQQQSRNRYHYHR